MGVNEIAESHFRAMLRRERESRKWSQAHMAKLLSDKGLTVYPTTVAKIEAGERAAKIDELVATADIFNVSVDALLGHSTRRTQTGDKGLAFSALHRAAQHSAGLTEWAEVGLRHTLTDLDPFDLRKDERTAQAECEHACDALADAVAAIRKAQSRLQRIQRRTQEEFWADDSHKDEENE